MKITDLDHKRICILGFGREGRSTLSVLELFAPHAHITIADRQPVTILDPKYQRIEGGTYLDDLHQFDFIIKSPGIAWRPSADVAPKVTTATQIFLDSLPAGARTIGITGTKGKSSTANLIFHILSANHQPVFLAGNIGSPMLDLLPGAAPDQIYVLELSSYQLQDLSSSPHIAVVTSFFPDHVDYHGSLESYFEAKTHIARYQRPDDTVYFNANSAECRQIAELSPGWSSGFSASSLPKTVLSHLPSGTPADNVAAAYLVATDFDIPEDDIAAALKTAPGLPHRQQSLGQHLGIAWIDDSAATTPQSTQIALSALAGSVDTLIAGGLNREYDFTDLANQIAVSQIKNLILFPETGALLRQKIEALKPTTSIQYFETQDMNEAVALGASHTKIGKVCLLSSGAPSYNLYNNFNERGDAFKKAVTALDE